MPEPKLERRGQPNDNASVGAWGVRAFDNDDANDWAYGLDGVDDLSLVESALAAVENADGYLEVDVGCSALAACEVIARLLGRVGHSDTWTEKVDRWVAAHKIEPSSQLIARALTAIDRVRGEDSEVRELWEDAGEAAWSEAVAELRSRIAS